MSPRSAGRPSLRELFFPRLVLLSLVPIILVGSVSLLMLFHRVRQDIESQLQSSAFFASGLLENRVPLIHQSIALASVAVLQGEDTLRQSKLENALRYLLNQNGAVEDITITGPEGERLAYVSRLFLDTPLTDAADAPAKASGDAWGRLYVHPVTGEYLITSAARFMVSDQGRGYTNLVSVRLPALTEAIRQYRSDLGSSVLLARTDGSLVFRSDSRIVYSSPPAEIRDGIARDPLRGWVVQRTVPLGDKEGGLVVIAQEGLVAAWLPFGIGALVTAAFLVLAFAGIWRLLSLVDSSLVSPVAALAQASRSFVVGRPFEQLPEHASREITELRDLLEALADRVNTNAKELQSLAAQREALLQETHHRVKNNLQIVRSLIALEQNIDGEGALERINNRIAAMALVHELAYASDDYASIPVEAYLSGLLYLLDVTEPLTITDSALSAHLSLNAAIPLGMLVVEITDKAGSSACRQAWKIEGTSRGKLTIVVSGEGLKSLEASPIAAALLAQTKGTASGPTATKNAADTVSQKAELRIEVPLSENNDIQ